MNCIDAGPRRRSFLMADILESQFKSSTTDKTQDKVNDFRHSLNSPEVFNNPINERLRFLNSTTAPMDFNAQVMANVPRIPTIEISTVHDMNLRQLQEFNHYYQMYKSELNQNNTKGENILI